MENYFILQGLTRALVIFRDHTALSLEAFQNDTDISSEGRLAHEIKHDARNQNI